MVKTSAREGRWTARGRSIFSLHSQKSSELYLPESFPNVVTADALGYEPSAGDLNCSSLSLLVPATSGLEAASKVALVCPSVP